MPGLRTTEEAFTAAVAAAAAITAVRCAAAAAAEFGARVLPRVRPPASLARLAAAVGCAVVVATPAGAKQHGAKQRLAPPARPAPQAPAPWPGSGEPTPPGSLDRAGRPHPAIHGDRGPAGGRLFPREVRYDGAAIPLFSYEGAGRPSRRRGEDGSATGSRAGRRLLTHTCGTPRRDHGASRCYTVVPGDSLWHIAEHVVGGDDRFRVSGYVSRLHRSNARVIGSDPDLILSGQVLRLPPR